MFFLFFKLSMAYIFYSYGSCTINVNIVPRTGCPWIHHEHQDEYDYLRKTSVTIAGEVATN